MKSGRILPEVICGFPGDRSEAGWVDAIEYLKLSLSGSLKTNVQVGCYWVGDFPGHLSAGCVARVRSRDPIADVDSDSWEGLLGWSGSRGKTGNAYALIFPFQNGSVVQQRGRLSDLGPDAEADELLAYRFEMGHFVFDGWVPEDGPGEWAGVKNPGDVYWQRLKCVTTQSTFEANKPLTLSFQLEQPTAKVHFDSARISLVHVNRSRENTNLVPWTARPPKADSQRTMKGSEAKLTTPQSFQIRLDQFSIRGGWIPGDYYLSVRVQNFRDPNDWRWTCDISPPIKITIV